MSLEYNEERMHITRKKEGGRIEKEYKEKH